MTTLLARSTRRTTTGAAPSGDRARALLAVALRPTGIALAAVCAAVVVVLVSSNSDLAGAVGGVAAGWLALHHVSLTVTDAPLGVLPLLPTILLMWAVARGCARAVHPDSDPRVAGQVIAAAIAGPIAATLIAFAVVGDAEGTLPLVSPSIAPALAAVVGIHALSAVAGVLTTAGRSLCRRWGLPGWVPSAVVPGARAAGLLFAAGTAVTTASLVWSWSDVGALLAEGSGVVGVLGLTVLSVLYLPNAAIGGVAVLLGGTAHAGGTTLSLFAVDAGPVPPVPVLGGVPTELVGTAWPVLLAIPVTIGALLGRDCGRIHLSVQRTASVVALAAAGAGVLAALAGVLAGGDLGAYGYVGVDPALLGLITFGWLLVPGLIVGVLVTRRAVVEPDPEEEHDPDVATDTLTAPDTVPETAVPDFEIKRLERPAVRYRADTAAELEAPAGITEAGTPENGTPEVVEAEIVDEPEAEMTPVTEGDLPEGPVTPSD
ncbi:DUF6350 family protein [Prescottella subtropica]|uniref:cell division protein PerM n=1 Tax=Prescottella subtropica TaxID=2545757 RepID=UPI0010F6E1A9|nr:DUF6350 family protein [Prescottella subtropica]